jgi:hypothetical protein
MPTKGQANAWPFLFGSNPRIKTLTANSRKTRDQAESAFSKTQTQFLSLGRILSEQDAISQAREAKTARLRELRLDKQADDLAAAAAAPAPKRGAKR